MHRSRMSWPLLSRRRERGLPSPVNQEALESIGIPAGNAPRTLQALRFLYLLDAEGQQTSNMDRLARATSSEYQQVLVEVIQSAYPPVFAIVDPKPRMGILPSAMRSADLNPQHNATEWLRCLWVSVGQWA